MKNRKKSIIFAEVKSDFVDSEDNISIDAYAIKDPNAEGLVVALITPDGKIIKKTNFNVYFTCPLVQDAIEAAKIKQEEKKLKLIEKVADVMHDDFRKGDTTAITELLKSCSIENLKAYLPD